MRGFPTCSCYSGGAGCFLTFCLDDLGGVYVVVHDWRCFAHLVGLLPLPFGFVCRYRAGLLFKAFSTELGLDVHTNWRFHYEYIYPLHTTFYYVHSSE